jgi:exopolysaccharide biosynthesis polyprenyl glycosylphosphotransferase
MSESPKSRASAGHLIPRQLNGDAGTRGNVAVRRPSDATYADRVEPRGSVQLTVRPTACDDAERHGRSLAIAGSGMSLAGCAAIGTIVIVLVDVTALIGALAVAGSLRAVGLTYAAAALVSLALLGTYQPRFNLRMADYLAPVMEGLALSFVAVVVATLPRHELPALLRTMVAAAAVVPLGRAAAYAFIRRLRIRGRLAERALIVGSGKVGAEITTILNEHPEYGLVPAGILDVDGTETGSAVDLNPSVLHRAIRDHGVARLIVAFGRLRDSDLVALLRKCEPLPVRIHIVPRLFELGLAGGVRVDDLCGFPLIRIRGGINRSVARAAKRIFDLVVGSLLLLLSTPVFIAAATAVRLSSPGPVFFRQKRVGENGRIIEVSKFRTLLCNDDSDETWNVANDDRQTLPGRFLRNTGLDELPQLINVLRGDMSLVGPRPERPYFADRFTAEVPRYADRQRAPQGITGWAQVHGLRGDTSIPDRIRMDNYYIDNWTMWRDISIVAKTVTTMLGRRGT